MQTISMISITATSTIMPKTNNSSFADIHTHILPKFDDGARTVEESLKMILSEIRQGVTDIALTPHFSLENESIEEFLKRRDASFGLLSDKIKENGLSDKIRLHLGAEVKYYPNLIYSDIFKLCIGDTSYLLLELDKSHPFNLEQTVDYMLSKGVTPIFAHVERYSFLIKNKKLMERFLYEGVVFQSNASSLLGQHYKREIKKLIKGGYVKLLASDTHSTEERPPLLRDALLSIPKYSEMFISNSVKVIENKLI